MPELTHVFLIDGHAFADANEAEAYGARFSLGPRPTQLKIEAGNGRIWRRIYAVGLWVGDGSVAFESGIDPDSHWVFDFPANCTPEPDHCVDTCSDERIARVTAWSYLSLSDARVRATNVRERELNLMRRFPTARIELREGGADVTVPPGHPLPATVRCVPVFTWLDVCCQYRHAHEAGVAALIGICQTNPLVADRTIVTNSKTWICLPLARIELAPGFSGPAFASPEEDHADGR